MAIGGAFVGVLTDQLFPVDQGLIEQGIEPWFNHRGTRVECSWTNWDAPDGRRLRVALTAACPMCHHPFLLPLREGMFQVDDEGRLSLLGPLVCPGHYQQLDDNGRPTGRMQRCGWMGVVRNGAAHHPQCRAVHDNGCPGTAGQRCACTGRGLGPQYCNCGAAREEG